MSINADHPWKCGQCGLLTASSVQEHFMTCSGGRETQARAAVGEERAAKVPDVWFKHILSDRDFSETVQECDRLLTVKGHDYTQGASRGADGRDRLKNFYRNAERLGLSARQVLAVYMNKHLDAIETYLKAGQVESEPIEGRICDAINYLLLLAKMVRIEAREKAKP